MTAVTNVSNGQQRGISKKTLRILVIGLVLLLFAFFIFSYFSGYNVLTPLKNSRFNLGPPTPPTFVYSIYGEGNQGQLKKPMGVTAAGGNIYISDTGNQRVQVYNAKGRFVLSFGKKGTGQGEFLFPYGIALDKDNNIYVADMQAGNIQVFSPQGDFIKYFAQNNPEERAFKSPAGLFYRDGKLYATDLGTGSVKIFDAASGEKLNEFGKLGDGPGQFAAPNAVTVTSDAIIVSDSHNDNLQVFSLTGEFQSKMDGSTDGRNPRLLTARGVGVDGRGVIYGVSMMGNYITGFDKKGNFLWSFGKSGAEDDQVYLPNGLFVDAQGRIYITDQGNSKVSVWEN